MASNSFHPTHIQGFSAPDVLVVGAGTIGLSLALELHARGARVSLLERDTALSHASTAAAGMLAANDPHNPSALHQLSHFSIELYPDFLRRIERLSGIAVPFQTDTTLQYQPNGTINRLAENSLEPRNLAAALLAAIRNAGIELHEHTEFQPTAVSPSQMIVYATGAWLPHDSIHAPTIRPRKGQMLRVQLPPGLRGLHEVHRSDEIYIVPRTSGPQAGSALIGATIEDAGYDTSTHPRDLTHLRSLAAKLLTVLADESSSPQLEAWAGLRPHTPDGLPLLGALEPGSRHFVATGHYRNGILLAPATAVVLADLIETKPSALNLAPFSPARFAVS